MKIALLISGGVDSSVALRLLHEQGHDVTAFYLKIWLEDELAWLGECPWEEDLEYIRQVCAHINVPVEVVPLQRAYWDRVVTYTINEIKAGRTPNPDMLCNEQIKFGAFYELMEHHAEHFDKIATGHYARVEEFDGLYHLMCAPDPIKDQTYFLALLTQKQLSRALFPIGHLHKSEVRALAQEFNLPNKERKDSQGICFLGKLKFSEFVKYHVGVQKGSLIDYDTGNVMGEHDGFWYYTIGQRQGIGLSGGPWYVVDKDTHKNIVYISKNYYEIKKSRDTFDVAIRNWTLGFEPKLENLEVKIRHGAMLYPCAIIKNANGSLRVKIDQQDQGIAAGQFAVFYRHQNQGVRECLGAGVIV